MTQFSNNTITHGITFMFYVEDLCIAVFITLVLEHNRSVGMSRMDWIILVALPYCVSSSIAVR